MKKATLEVSLNTALDPPVIISKRKFDANGRGIRWKMKKGADYTFKQLNELDQAYFNKQSINLKRKTITCNNRAPGGYECAYEIVVTQNNVDYTSTKTGTPPDGNPVIRN